jgi:hypothetical protein
MGMKTMKADGCTLPLPLDGGELSLPSKAQADGAVKRFRGFIETVDWEDVVNRLERPVDILCWAAVTAAALVIIPICIRLLAE